MTEPLALVPLAVVIGAHGVRGELRVKLLNPESELLGPRRHAILRAAQDGATRAVTILGVRPTQPGLLLISIDGCGDRDSALALRGAELCVPRAELPQLVDGEFYLVDLIGLATELEDGTNFGVVEDAVQYPASTVLRVRTARGRVEVPLFAPYLVAVELARRAVVVRHVDELDVEPD